MLQSSLPRRMSRTTTADPIAAATDPAKMPMEIGRSQLPSHESDTNAPPTAPPSAPRSMTAANVEARIHRGGRAEIESAEPFDGVASVGVAVMWSL